MDELLRCRGDRVRLPSVLQVLEMECLTARVELGPDWEVEVEEGALVAARMGALQGVPAAVELQLEVVPELRVVGVPAGPPRRPLSPLPSVLLEGARIQDEWARLGPSALRVHPAAAATLPAALRGLAADTHAGRGLEVVRRALGLARVQLVDLLLALVESGGAELAPAVEEPQGDYDDWLFEGRRLFRAGQRGAAAAAFRNALRLRPDDAVAAANLRRVAAALQEAA